MRATQFSRTQQRELFNFFARIAQLTDRSRQEIALNYPEYTKSLALNDTRANQTSWSYFKKWKAKRAAVCR